MRAYFTFQTLVTFFIGILVGFGVYVTFDKAPTKPSSLADTENSVEGIVPLGSDSTEPELVALDTTNTAKKPVATVAEGENILVVSNQPAGSAVIISMASLAKDGWLAVHEADEAGEMISILGARRFRAGKHFGESIDLLRSTLVGQTYFVVLHGDDGDSEFDHEREVPLEDPAIGEPVRAEFIATSAGSNI